MNFLQLYIDAFKQFFNFKGKSTRTAFWAFVIISTLVSMLLTAVFPTLANIYALVALIPSIMLCIRRARDTGYTAFLAFVILIPVVGLLVLGLLPSKK